MARVGLSRTTGTILTGWDHCAQSIANIASTLIGERVMRREIGSDVPGLQDRPQTPAEIVLHFSALANALRLWEPGFRLKRLRVTRLGPEGVAGFGLGGDFYPNGHLGDYSVIETDRDVLVPFAAGGALG